MTSKIDGKVIYYWDDTEKALNNTPQHMLVKKELNPYAHEDSKDFALRYAEFLVRHPEFINK